MGIKQKFTPSIVPKNVKLYDEGKKLHVKFEADSDNENEIKVTHLPVKRQALASPETKQSNGSPQKKQKTGKQTATVIEKPKVIDERTLALKRALEEATQDEKKKLRSEYRQAVKKERIHKQREKVKKSLTEEQIEALKKKKREKSKRRRAAKAEVDGVKINRPVLSLQLTAIKKNLEIKSIRDFIIYSLAEAKTPKWSTIVNKSSVRHLALVYADGLDITYFGIEKSRQNVPSYVDLSSLDSKCVGKAALPFFTSCFSHMIVNKISGKKGKIVSPVTEVLQCRTPINRLEAMKADVENRIKKCTDKAEFYTIPLEQMIAQSYPIPPSLDPSAELPEGWKETPAAKQPAKKKRLIAVDCEMVQTTSGSALARVTLVGEDGATLLDEYVKPSEPIVDYVTKYSGITPEIMEKTTCSLRRAQKHIRKIVDHNVILVGHGLENDLRAMKIAHPYCADTALLYDHFRGPPFKPALKILARNILKRNIQDANKANIGHDSAEDAIAALDLFKLKVKRGPYFGRFERGTELLFDRLDHFKPSKTSAIVERADKGSSKFKSVARSIYTRCQTDEEFVKRTIDMLKEKDFVFSCINLTIAENDDETTVAPQVLPAQVEESPRSLSRLVDFDLYFKELYTNAPSGTLFVVMGGLGDVPEYKKLYAHYMRCHGEALENAAEGETWTPTDQKRLEGYGAKARLSSTFIALKQ